VNHRSIGLEVSFVLIVIASLFGVVPASSASSALADPPGFPGVVRPSDGGLTWHLRDSQTSGPATLSFAYGLAGDFPVTGDWDRDGTVTPGVLRGNTWYLRNGNSAGAANIVFSYGLATDFPVTGDWDGDGTVTPGVLRGNTWYLRNGNSAGAANTVFTYGTAFDFPIVWQ
jgi:hypothetical protein